MDIARKGHHPGAMFKLPGDGRSTPGSPRGKLCKTIELIVGLEEE